jgi:hypothetical protein
MGSFPTFSLWSAHSLPRCLHATGLQLEAKQTDEEKAFRPNVASGRGPTNHLANIRLFDSPEGTEPRITL